MPGLRIVRVDRHPSAIAGRVGNRSRLHLHDTQAAATGDEARGQELDPGMP
jgi:hypothetical protein